jgi:aminoglycoside phosphotransferase
VTHVRLGWADLPAPVRAGVEEILGGAVVEAVGQAGGFSPGVADRVRTAGGHRAFVKAAGVELNPTTVELHRREGRVVASLPPSVPAPRLLGVHDDGRWIALVLQDVPGRHPRTPWEAAELSAVLAALGELANRCTPAPTLAAAPRPLRASEIVAGGAAAWRRIAAAAPADLDPWATAHLDLLQALADEADPLLAGDTLVHLDVRADNLLVDGTGRVTIVDWPYATTGPRWLDTLLLAVNVRLHGGHDVDALLAAAPVTADVAPRVLTGVLAGMAGSFFEVSGRPPPPGIPTVRAFQRRHADVLLDWVRARLNDATG